MSNPFRLHAGAHSNVLECMWKTIEDAFWYRC